MSQKIWICLGIGLMGMGWIKAQDKVATVEGFGHSVVLESATASTLFGFFTTFDNQFNQEPLFQNIGGSRLYGREMSALLSSRNRYLSDYVFFNPNGTLLEYGWMELSIPLGDGDQNGVPDVFQTGEFGSFSFSGNGQGDTPPRTAYTITGAVNRQPESSTGTYQMLWRAGQGTLNLQGQIRLTQLNGTIGYRRGQTNSITFQLNYTGPDALPLALNGTASFQVMSPDQIQVGAFALSDNNGNTANVNSFLLQRDEAQYTGVLSLSDGFFATGWADYQNHTIVIQDANDADGDSVPDLSDNYTPPPTIVTQPVSQPVAEGGTVMLSIAATDTNAITYQWRFNNQVLLGATLDRLTISDFRQANVGAYDVIVANFANFVVSEPASLTLVRAPVITLQPVGQSVPTGSTVTLIVEATGSAPLTYQWFRNNIAVQNANQTQLVLDNVQVGHAGNYRVDVSNSAGKAVSSTVVLQVGSPPVIVQQPVSQSVQTGASVVFQVTVSGNGPFQYQWRKDGTALTGKTQSQLSIQPVSIADAGRYSVVVTSATGSVTSANANLTVHQKLLTGDFDDQGRFSLTLRGKPGGNYRIDWSRNLEEWQELTSYSNLDGPVTFQDELMNNRRYYRAIEF